MGRTTPKQDKPKTRWEVFEAGIAKLDVAKDRVLAAQRRMTLSEDALILSDAYSLIVKAKDELLRAYG